MRRNEPEICGGAKKSSDTSSPLGIFRWLDDSECLLYVDRKCRGKEAKFQADVN